MVFFRDWSVLLKIDQLVESNFCFGIHSHIIAYICLKGIKGIFVVSTLKINENSF